MEHWSPASPPGQWVSDRIGAAAPLRNVRVLVVEDEPLIAMCVEIALHEFGAIAFVANERSRG